MAGSAAAGRPDCGAVIEEATGPVGRPPRAGDCSVCLYCRTISVFTGVGLELRRPTEAEMGRFLADPDVHRAISVSTAVDRFRRRNTGR